MNCKRKVNFYNYICVLFFFNYKYCKIFIFKNIFLYLKSNKKEKRNEEMKKKYDVMFFMRKISM